MNRSCRHYATLNVRHRKTNSRISLICDIKKKTLKIKRSDLPLPEVESKGRDNQRKVFRKYKF